MARVAQWSIAHRWIVVVGWILLTVAGGLAAARSSGFGSPLILGERAIPGCRGRAAATAGQAPGRFTTFPGEIFRVPRSWAEASYPTLTYFNEAERGGHFAAWEEPELFTTEVRAAFRKLR